MLYSASRSPSPVLCVVTPASSQHKGSVPPLSPLSDEYCSDFWAGGEPPAGRSDVLGVRGGERGEFWTQQSRARQLGAGESDLLQTQRLVTSSTQYLLTFSLLNNVSDHLEILRLSGLELIFAKEF